MKFPKHKKDQLCRKPRFYLVWAALLFFFTTAGLSAASLKASLDRSTVPVGESLTLSLVFEDGAPSTQPQLPGIPNVQVAGVSSFRNFSIINGKSSQQTTYNYTLIPTKVGDVTIPSVRVNVGGQNLASQPLRLKVTQAMAADTTANGQPAEAFLKLIVPKTEMFVGEIVPAEINLYFHHLQGANLPQLPAEGFTMSPMPNRPEQRQTQVNGVNYNVAIFRFSISPARTGQLTLGPANCGITIITNPRRDIFGGIHGDPRQLSLNADPVSINVLPLPQDNKPASFTGAIGSFNMNVSAGPTDVAVGDPITVKVEIQGRGALDTLTLPPQTAWREFKSYPPNVRIDTSDPLGLEGVKHFELVISPQNAAIKELPPLEFSFFDTEQKAYRTVSSQPIRLNVRPSAATPQPTIASSAASQTETPQQTKEIVHIKASLGTLGSEGKPLVTQPWFLGLQALAPLLWLGSIMLRKQREKLDNNPRLRRQKAVEKTVSAGLEKLKTQAAENKSEEFFANVFHLLQEQIGERLDQPASGITESVLDDELKNRDLKPETLSLLQELFQICNQARYAPVRGSQQLAALIPRVEQALNALKQMKNEKAAATV